MSKIFLVARVIFGILGALIALVVLALFLINLRGGSPQLMLAVVIDCLIVAGCLWLIISGVNKALSDRVDREGHGGGKN